MRRIRVDRPRIWRGRARTEDPSANPRDLDVVRVQGAGPCPTGRIVPGQPGSVGENLWP
jgi:hypothetical protein